MTDAGKRILIMEDEKPLSKALDLKLKGAGFDTIVASNGDEGLAALEKTQFDLVLMDLMMPQRNGFSVLEELNKKGSKVPIFVMSNLGQEEDVDRAMKLGAKDYVVKSNTPLADIVARVKKQLGI